MFFFLIYVYLLHSPMQSLHYCFSFLKATRWHDSGPVWLKCCKVQGAPQQHCGLDTWHSRRLQVYFKHKAFRTGIGVTFYRIMGDKAVTDATCCLRGPSLQSVNNTLELDSQTAFPDSRDKNQEHCSRVSHSVHSLIEKTWVCQLSVAPCQ